MCNKIIGGHSALTPLSKFTPITSHLWASLICTVMGIAAIEHWERAHPPSAAKFPKLEHVALNSASETSAEMRQKASLRHICKLNFRNFLGLCPQTPIPGRGYGAPLQTPLPSALRSFSGASRLPRLARGLRPLHRPPTRNPGSTPGRGAPTL